MRNQATSKTVTPPTTAKARAGSLLRETRLMPVLSIDSNTFFGTGMWVRETHNPTRAQRYSWLPAHATVGMREGWLDAAYSIVLLPSGL